MAIRIEAHNLHKTFGSTRAVNGVSLEVHEGEAYGLVGPDGAGKTTTMRLLVGALTSEEGSVHIDGHDLRTRTEQARARVGYLAQRFSLYTDLTVAENIQFFGEVRGVVGPAFVARAAELLQFVGLAGFEQRLAGLLSGGMKQKLGLACALIHRPGVLLLDEPSGGVDPVTRQDFWQLIIRLLTDEGLAVIVSTPYMDEAVRCNRIGFMYGGQVLVEGPPRELTARLDGRVLEVVARPGMTARQVCLENAEVEDAVVFGDRLHLRLGERYARREGDQQHPDLASLVLRLSQALEAEGVRVARLRPIAPGLEDVFISLLQQQGEAR
ncbi:MAG: ABC transporter ATP-binding protein [Chloroflexaceae bacterium]|nr:ABC transporter ATP-binding protein [Chloroflexaceae bacterium]